MTPEWLLASMRGSAAAYLTDRCAIYAMTQTQDPYGAPDETPALVASAVPCRVIKTGEKTTASSQIAAGQETLAEEYELQVGPDVALAADQEVEVGGERYQVVRLETALTARFWRTAVIVRR